jgi:hypothetical protein
MINFMSKNHYTYAYLRLDGTPYYIGRGKGRRAFSKNHTVPPPPKERVLFLKTGLTFAESVQHEIYMIAIFGRKNNGTGILRNLTDGGDGTPGFKFSEEQLQHRREVQTGRQAPETHRQSISEGMKRLWANGHSNNASKAPRPTVAGEKNYRSKITDDERREIAATWIPGNRNAGTGNGRELAEKYGLNIETIRQIAKDPRWTS